jgi:hypothetical protein
MMLIFLAVHDVAAQIEVRPNSKFPPFSAGTVNLRMAEEEPLPLPFWDDFSGYEGAPDPALWEESENVSINRTMGINPPSLGVATMDGLMGSGRPYSANEVEQGIADVLMSRPINLDTVPLDKRNTIYISFFWQIKGRGEMPNDEEGDRISLQFKNGEEWEEVWNPEASYSRLNVTGYHQLETDRFYQEVIAIDAKFINRNFQFRFQTTGRLSGPFDTWNLDYIYLHYNRDAQDYYTFDRTLTKIPTSIFKDYHAIPLKHFKNNPTKYSGISNAEGYNLDEVSQSVRFRVTVYDTLATDKTPIVLNDSSFVINSLQRVTLPSGALDFSSLTFDADSAYLKTQYTFFTGDKWDVKSVSATDTVFHKHVDFRSNDTTSTLNVLHNYYAYDDGTAEFNAGISQQHGKLAYQYIISEQDTLKAIKIHFPNMSPSPAGRTLELTIWDDIGTREVVLSRRNIEVQGAAVNEFNTYDLIPALIVKDTFYIGWTQSSDGYLGVGLDKNTNSGNRIWSNVDGGWVQNTRIEGSLMIRPVFGRGEVTTSIDEGPASQIPPIDKAIIYPNPGEGQFFIKGYFDKISLYDMRGVEIITPIHMDNNGNGVFDLTGFPGGIYIIHIFYQDKIQRQKIILR